MKLIKTDDGAYGVEVSNKMYVWVNTKKEVINLMFNAFEVHAHVSKEYMEEEVNYAFESMRENKTNISEFGVLGSFMYSITDDELNDNDETSH